MTRKEAINEIKSWAIPSKNGREVLETLIPELIESEDEKIRRELIEFIQWSEDRGMTRHDFHQAKRPSEWIAYLEKQKDASKAIEAVDRIDKYIDENVANAHDMKDSNPDKQYYRGWDEALGEMAGILQDVYSEKENKFVPRVLPCSAAWFEDGDEKQKEQKPVKCELEDAFKYYTDAGITISCEDIVAKPKDQKPEPVFKVGDKIKLKSEPTYPYREIVDIKNGAYYFDEAVHLPFDNQNNWEKEQKPVEKQDYSGLTEFERAIHRGFLSAGIEDVPVVIIKETAQDCLTSVEQKQEWGEEDIRNLNNIIWLCENCIGGHETTWIPSQAAEIKDLINRVLKSLYPSWKPSELQMEALLNILHPDDPYYYELKSLYEQLEEL